MGWVSTPLIGVVTRAHLTAFAMFSRFFSSRFTSLQNGRIVMKPGGGFPCHVTKRKYYVKPKKKESGSGQAWLVLAGVTLTVSGGALYLLGSDYNTSLLAFEIILLM